MKRSNLNIVYYHQVDGCWTVSDSRLKGIYDDLENAGYIKRVFYSGSVSTFPGFLDYFKSMRAFLFMVCEGGDPVLLVWVNEFAGTRAIVHFCGMPGAAARLKVEAGKLIVSHLLKAFDVIVGITPETYREAIHMAQLSGMKVCGTVPKMIYLKYENKQVGAVFSYAERSA